LPVNFLSVIRSSILRCMLCKLKGCFNNQLIIFFLRSSKMKEKSISIDTSAIRQKLGLNQQQFWARLGVTQSGGSRYENGRRIPRPVQQLVHLMYVENIDIQKIKREDFEVIEYLRANKPAFLKELKKEAKAAAAAAKKGG
jgi:hypothetical protein